MEFQALIKPKMLKKSMYSFILDSLMLYLSCLLMLITLLSVVGNANNSLQNNIYEQDKFHSDMSMKQF